MAPSTPDAARVFRTAPSFLARGLLSLHLVASGACKRGASETQTPEAPADKPTATAAGHAIEGWDTLIYPDRHLSVAFPTGWERSEKSGENPEDGLAFWELQAEDSDSLYYLSVEDMGGIVEPESGGEQELFNGFVAESLRSFGGELLGVQMMTLRGYPGVGYDIAIAGEDPDTPFRIADRMFLVGSFRVLIFGYSSDPVADELELFLENLELLPTVDGWARQAYEEGWDDLAMANVAWRDEHTVPSRKEEAIVAYTRALESGMFEGPFAGGIEDRMARILFLLGREDSALEHLDRAARLGFETLASAQIRGLIYFGKKQYAKAIEQYDRVVNEGGADPNVLFLRINAMAGQVGLEEARLAEGQAKRGEVDVLVNQLVEDINKAVQAAPDHAGLRVWSGVVRLRNADRNGATLDMRRALAAEPESFEARLKWAWELLGVDATAEATNYATYLDRLGEGDGLVTRLAGELHLVARDYAGALPRFEALTKGSDARPELVCKHAGVLNRLHREKESLDLYARAYRVAPRDESCANSYAWLLATSTDASLRNGELAVAAVERFVYREGKQLPPDELSSAVVDTLAAAYAEAGRWSEAVATQKLAIRIARQKGYDDESLTRFQDRLELFENQKAHRERWSEPDEE